MNRILCVLLTLCVSTANAQQRFSELVGPVGVENVKPGNLEFRWLTWGGDVATFHANGGLTTATGSNFDRLGLKLKLTKGDDFVQQVRDYMSGKIPVLRGTFDQIGEALEVINSDPRTKPIVFLQLTWSAGDHVVAREEIKSINDLLRVGKKVKIAVQQGGPHVGFVYAILNAAQAKKDQIEIVWCQDLSGPKGPAELFRKDSTIDAACVITPDMLGLSGGLDAKGSGAEGTVKGAHVVVSTQQMSRAIPDIYVARSDWFKENKETVDKFVAGYLKSCEELVGLRKQFNETNKLNPEYRKILTVAQNAFGKDVIPTLEVDGHGLLLDALFAGLPGQISFFEDKGNLNGYEAKAKTATDLSVEWGYASNRFGFIPAKLDYVKIAGLAGLKYEAPKLVNSIDGEAVNLFPDSNLDERTILTFSINFEPNQNEFTVDQYGDKFQQAVKTASDFRGGVLVIRGFSDPTKTLVDLIKAGMAKGLIKRTGDAGNFKYYFNGKELDLTATDAIVKLIEAGAFDGTNPSPRETMQAALNLSDIRAQAVKTALAKFAADAKVNLDLTQVRPIGVGIQEPLVARPKNIEEAKKNMRVEFRVIKINSEAIKSSDFEY